MDAYAWTSSPIHIRSMARLMVRGMGRPAALYVCKILRQPGQPAAQAKRNRLIARKLLERLAREGR